MTGPVLVLVGPPGSGKSTVGPMLAERLGVGFADADVDLERLAGRTIADIFTTDGEPAFRALEEKVVAAGLGEHVGVFSLGGGAVLSADTRALLAGRVVAFLNVGMAAGVKRTGLSAARPLLAGVNPRARFKELLDARLPLYREVAIVEVATDDISPEQVVDSIVAAVDELREGS
ncbi:MAG: shikimate kinase [Haloechinothrix sp.]